MPLIELSLPTGALEPSTRDALVADLTTLVLAYQHAPDNEITRSISWAYVDERALYVGGHPADTPHVRVKLTIPQFALDEEHKEHLVDALTARVVEALGPGGDPCNVWVLIDEVTDGNWAGGGRVYHFRDIAALINGGGRRLLPAA
jgi:phenylpyruvate tautomerase PptA (4-oxalocrotonate tautomerase family)